jgi:hypothetical protein
MAEDKQDKLARQIPGSSELSIRLSELPPLEQVLARVQIRWPFPEMGELERQDWREVLKDMDLADVMAALQRLMEDPPKQSLGDGTVQQWRGRPTVVDVTQTIQILQEERAAEWRRKDGERQLAELRELQKRKDAGEKFYGIADVLAAAKPSEALKPMPNVKTQWPDFDPDRNRAKLEQQKKDLGIP